MTDTQDPERLDGWTRRALAGGARMTDPRAAALAEALGDLFPHHQREKWPLTPLDAAAAILAALPPDWCGHIGVEEVIAQAQARLIASEVAADREITRLNDRIFAIEAEAVAAERARIRAAVEGLPRRDDRQTHSSMTFIERAAVLTIIEPAR